MRNKYFLLDINIKKTFDYILSSNISYFEIQYDNKKTLIFGKPFHIHCGFNKSILKEHLFNLNKEINLEKYFGWFYIIEIKIDNINIISSSSTHGVFFCRKDEKLRISTNIELLIDEAVFKVDLEQCFLYVTQNINHEPFYSLIKNIYRAPGMTLLSLNNKESRVYSLPVSRMAPGEIEREFLDTLDEFGKKAHLIYKNPCFTVSGGIDGIVLAAATGLHSKKICILNGYESVFERFICFIFKEKIKAKNIKVDLKECSDFSFNKKFDESYSQLIKPNITSDNYKLRAIENEVFHWRNEATLINGYGVDESYEWFRPYGIAYTTIDADKIFYIVDYVISQIINLFQRKDITSHFRNSKIFAGGASKRQGLYDYYKKLEKERILRCLNAISPEGYDYHKEPFDNENSLLFLKKLKFKEFSAKHFFANSVHLLRFHYLFSNPLIISAQPWENMPFIRLFANLSIEKKFSLRPKELLFKYLTIKDLDYINILKEARKHYNKKKLFGGIRQSIIFLPLWNLMRMIKNCIVNYKNKFILPISDKERERLKKYLMASSERPQNYLNNNLKLRNYYQSLERCVIQGKRTPYVTGHEIRNYVQLCYMLSNWKKK